MNTIITRIAISALCLYMLPAEAKIQFKCTTSVIAYKADPATHAQTWSLQTTSSPKRGTPNETIFSSTTIKNFKKGILLSTRRPTYLFVYKNDKAAGLPIQSIITPDMIKRAGDNPRLIIKTNGTALLEAAK